MTRHTARSTPAEAWPALRVDSWTDTRETLHMWAQVVGKVRLAKAPVVNHWWNVTMYVTPRGLCTSAIPDGSRLFDIEFDLYEHALVIRSSDGGTRRVVLSPMTVADFYAQVVEALRELDIEVSMRTRPTEVEVAIPFEQDHQHASYDPEAARTFWQQLVHAHRVITDFRSSFTGKVSPVHFFWGGFDLACTRFSGRSAPPHPGGVPNCGDWVMVESYSQELSSCGFWPGGGEEGAFYAYAYPEPVGFADHAVGPSGAFYSPEYRQFLLPYEAAREAEDSDAAVLEFLRETYEAAAVLGNWDRSTLETDPRRWAEKER